jgi:hypothetical protein
VEKGPATARAVGTLMGAVLALLSGRPAGADLTADLIPALRVLHVDRGAVLRFPDVRLLADATLGSPLRLHLDVNREDPEPVEVYEAYGEWGASTSRGRWGRFQTPFGIYNRSELYYVGLFLDPLIKNYPSNGPHLIDSASGLEYVGARRRWQIEGALFSHDGPGGVIPSGDEGSIRVQWFGGPLIVGASFFRERPPSEGGAAGEDSRFLGLDWRFSRPAWIVRGELVAGRAAGASPGGFYVDLIYHPVSLPTLTFVGRQEAVYGQRGGGSARRSTLGLKWEFLPRTSLAINQVFGGAGVSKEPPGTTLFLWYTHRLRWGAQ